MRVSFLNDWATESFGAKYYDRGIEALSSKTCLNLLKKSKNKQKEVKSNREIIIDPTEIAEKNCRKFYSSFHKDEKKNSNFNKLMFVRLKLKMKFRFFANLY